MELREFLVWLISGGAGVATYWLMENVKFLAGLGSEAKRYVALVLPALLAGAGYSLMVAFSYESMPGTPQEWFEKLFFVMTAVWVGQVVHGRLKLKS